MTRCKCNTIKRWTSNLKKIEKKVEIMPQNDGRRCMMSNVCQNVKLLTQVVKTHAKSKVYKSVFYFLFLLWVALCDVYILSFLQLMLLLDNPLMCCATPSLFAQMAQLLSLSLKVMIHTCMQNFLEDFKLIADFEKSYMVICTLMYLDPMHLHCTIYFGTYAIHLNEGNAV